MQLPLLRSSLLAGFVLLACGSEPFPEAERTATARFHLETGNPSGNVFKLEQATFELTGPESKSVSSDPLGPWVQVDVLPGSYSILLKDGWQLNHVSGPGYFDPTEARLVSTNPQLVTLPAGQVTDVVFKFTYGDTVPGKGEARARIGIQVEEPLCGNGVVDPGEECDVNAWPPSKVTCDSMCTGGGKTCSQDTDCASGQCKKGNCPECQTDADACNQACLTADQSCYGSCLDTTVTCNASCVSSETTCRNVCGAASAACWAGCWFDPIGCAATCEPPRAVCMNQCTSAKTACSNGCLSAEQACKGPCATAYDSCTVDCADKQESCVTNCNQCESCTDANQCPYLGK